MQFALTESEAADLHRQVAQLELDAARYRWLRERMEVRYQQPMSSGPARATLSFRPGHCFLDSERDPAAGWTDPKYFVECCEEVDNAVDSALGF